MSDYNEELSELHRQVVEEELGLSAALDEGGWVYFRHPAFSFDNPDLGELTVGLSKDRPEYMELICRFYLDETQEREDLMRICNSVNNRAMLAKLTLSESSNLVTSSVALLLSGPGSLPDKTLLRETLKPAMCEIANAIEAFFTLQ